MSKRPGTETDGADAATKKGKQIRVWCDGCYDMMHFGHANSLRQAKEMGDVLVVGVHNDEEITKHKGPPVFNEQERYKMVRSVKWVDEVVEGSPYQTQLEDLDAHNCDFCVHGDDITTTADGQDSYHLVKAAGRYRECKRTQGVSTTDLVGRLLLMTKSETGPSDPLHATATKEVADMKKGPTKRSAYTGVSHFLPTTQKLRQFSEGREPKPTDVIGYMAGSWDLYHVGHVDALAEAKKYCDFLIVGIHTDEAVREFTGNAKLPIMNLHERTLSVLANRNVDEVVIGAPFEVDADLLDHFRVSKVFQGSTNYLSPEGKNPYVVPQERGIFQLIDSKNPLTAKDIVTRIIANRMRYEERNAKKEAKEIAIQEALEKEKAAAAAAAASN